MTERGLIIGREELRDGDRREVRNPASGEVVGTYVYAGAAEVDQAVLLAKRVQPAWAATALVERQAIMRRAAELVEANVESIALTLTLEQGKPVPDARKEILFGAQVFRYYADKIEVLQGDVRTTSNPNVRSVVHHHPLGVIAGIVPWNYPVDLWAWKVAPALIAGNAIVMKPPVEAPLAAGQVARLMLEAGLPEGVLADLPGGLEAGTALSQHRDVRGISATCSTAAGVAIMRSAAPTLKRLTLELGGNCPFIVLADADLEAAATAAARRSFSNAGQICIAVNRIIVDASIADEFVERLAQRAARMVVGDGVREGVEMGPTTTSAVIEKTREHVNDAVAAGARLVVGAERLDPEGTGRGNFLSPAVLDRVPLSARMAREETFGPAVAVMHVQSTAEAVALANDSDYGLAAYLFTGDVEQGESLARELQFGGVGVNINDITELDAPFGGWKMSGFGRDLGVEGLLGMTQPQHVRTLGH